MLDMATNFIHRMLSLVEEILSSGFPPKTWEEAYAFIKKVLFDIIGSLSPMYIILFATAAAIVGFAGYKLFKIGLYGVGAVGLAYGAKYLAPFVVGYYQSFLPMGIDGTVALMVVAAIIGAVLARFNRKFLVLCLGGGLGYLIGSGFVAGEVAKYFNTLEFLKGDIASIAFGVVCAAICGILFLLIFQHAWIILTSIGGMATAGLLTGMLLMPNAGKMMWLYFVAAGGVVGIIAMIHQYQTEARENDIFYTFTL